MYKACELKAGGHPQKVMRQLGITYQHSTPQSMYDSWWFWNCENLPENLPDYLTELKIDPDDAIGQGLNRADAESIKTVALNSKS